MCLFSICHSPAASAERQKSTFFLAKMHIFYEFHFSALSMFSDICQRFLVFFPAACASFFSVRLCVVFSFIFTSFSAIFRVFWGPARASKQGLNLHAFFARLCLAFFRFFGASYRFLGRRAPPRGTPKSIKKRHFSLLWPSGLIP